MPVSADKRENETTGVIMRKEQQVLLHLPPPPHPHRSHSMLWACSVESRFKRLCAFVVCVAHPSACRMPLSPPPSPFFSLSPSPPSISSPLSSHRTLASQHRGEMRVKRRAPVNTWYSGQLQSRGVCFDLFPLPVP